MIATRREDDFADLVPETRDWHNGADIDPETWISCSGNYELAVGYSLLFWPRFIQIDDYILRHGTTKESLQSWEIAAKGDRRAVEAVINHIHIVDIHTDGEPSEQQILYIGRILKQTYEAKLKADFPERFFVVEFNDEPGLDPLDYELTFFQNWS